MTPRYLGLRVEFREIYLRKDIRHWISAADKILLLFQLEHWRIEFARSDNEEFGCHRPGGIDLRMNSVLGDRLLRTAESAEKVGGHDLLPAESAEDVLVREAYRSRNLLNAVRHISSFEILQM